MRITSIAAVLGAALALAACGSQPNTNASFQASTDVAYADQSDSQDYEYEGTSNETRRQLQRDHWAADPPSDAQRAQSLALNELSPEDRRAEIREMIEAEGL